jgi:putative ABC transport system ATP-binding protein
MNGESIPLLRVNKLSLNFGRPILNNINFEIHRGEILTLLGPSGSGKTSLLRCLNRLVTPDQGDILLSGKNILSQEITEVRRKIGMVFQVPSLLPGTVGENIGLGPKLHHRPWNDLQCQTLIDEIGLGREFLDRQIEQLSIGERQRVAFAQVLANDPEVLLLDEPTSALDASAARIIEDLIEKLHREKNLAVLMVTHDLAQAKRFECKALVLEDGALKP